MALGLGLGLRFVSNPSPTPSPNPKQAVVVGYRKPGEMFGETSLLQSGVATASIAADSEATLTRLNTPNPSPYP